MNAMEIQQWALKEIDRLQSEIHRLRESLETTDDPGGRRKVYQAIDERQVRVKRLMSEVYDEGVVKPVSDAEQLPKRPFLTDEWGDAEWTIFDMLIGTMVRDVRYWKGDERQERVREWGDLIEGAIEQNADELDELDEE